YAGMLRWTEGRLLSDVLAKTRDDKVVEDYFAQLGALTAAMHNQASAWRAPDVYSLIHADMHPGNILVDGDRLTVIDFDDAGFGWHQYDIAVVLTYWQSKPNAAEIERAFLDGYRATRPVSE